MKSDHDENTPLYGIAESWPTREKKKGEKKNSRTDRPASAAGAQHNSLTPDEGNDPGLTAEKGK